MTGRLEREIYLRLKRRAIGFRLRKTSRDSFVEALKAYLAQAEDERGPSSRRSSIAISSGPRGRRGGRMTTIATFCVWCTQLQRLFTFIQKPKDLLDCPG